MNTYRYRAAAGDGRLLSGSIAAASLAEATSQLIDRGLAPVALTPSAAASLRRHTAPARDIAVMFRSLSSLLDAGLPLDRALTATEALIAPRLRQLLGKARMDLTEGKPLASALGGETSPVPDAVLALLRAGERAGRLPQALDVIARSLEQEAELRGRVQQALAYPAILAVGGTASVGVITTVVIPRFADMLADVGQSLPPSTAALLAVSMFARRWWILLLAVAISTYAGVVAWMRTPAGRQLVHESLLRIPGVGSIRANLGGAKALNALAAALEAGMPLVPALALARDATGDLALSLRLHATGELLLEGAPLSASLTAKRALPVVAIQLLAVGESSGRLAAMADRAARLLRHDAEKQLETIVRLLEPMLVVTFGGIIALVAGALLQAVYSLRPIGT